jgi:hypothetical protein
VKTHLQLKINNNNNNNNKIVATCSFAGKTWGSTDAERHNQ